MGTEFGIGEVVAAGWTTFQKNALPLFMAVFAATVAGMVAMLAVGWIPVIGMIAAWYIQAFVMLGLWRVSLAAVDGNEVAVGHVFRVPPHWALAGLAFGLLGLATAPFALLLVVPALIVAALFKLWIPLIVDQNLPPFVALKESFYLVKPRVWTWVGLSLVAFLIVVAGLICLLVGLFPAVALVLVVYATAYRRLVPAQTALVPASEKGNPFWLVFGVGMVILVVIVAGAIFAATVYGPRLKHFLPAAPASAAVAPPAPIAPQAVAPDAQATIPAPAPAMDDPKPDAANAPSAPDQSAADKPAADKPDADKADPVPAPAPAAQP